MHRRVRLPSLAALICAAAAPWTGAPTASATTPVGELQHVLTAKDGASGDRLGSDVAISGNTIVVAATTHKVGGVADQGAAYVFTKPASGGWANATQTAELTYPVGETLLESVAISGNTIAVGNADLEVAGADHVGGVYVYTKPAGGWASTSKPTALLTASDGAANDLLGSSVAISGNVIVAGAPGHEVNGDQGRGAAYVFTATDSEWSTTTQAKLIGTSGKAGDEFGDSVAISGDTIVVGAPVHAVSGGGDGLAYLFIKPATGGWADTVQNRKLLPSDTAAPEGDFAGPQAIAISGDAIVIGAPGGGIHSPGIGPGAAYLFVPPDNGWGPPDTAGTDPVVNEVAKFTASDPNDQFPNLGFGVSVAFDGPVIAVGAPFHTVGGSDNTQPGAVYLFDEPTGGWKSTTQTTLVTASGGATQDGFGPVALDGSTLVVGAPGRAGSKGDAYVFAPPAPALSKVSQSHTSWTLGKKTTNVNPAHRPKGGTEFTFTVSQPATVSLGFSEKVHGALKQRGTIKVVAKKGRTTVWFDGVISAKRSLAAGHYAVTITAKNADGSSKPTTQHFVVKPAKHK
jgi:FG-GAP repeat